MVHRLDFGWIAVAGGLVGCASGESRPAASVASAPTIAIEPAPVRFSAEPGEVANPELTAWEQLLEREAVFRAPLEDNPCWVGWRHTLLVGDLDLDWKLAESAGCSWQNGDTESVGHMCCPESLETPWAFRTGGGGSCESALAEYKALLEHSPAAAQNQAAQPTTGQYASELSYEGYLESCELPADMTVYICAAVREGVALGVTVETRPPTGRIADCVANAVRGFRPARPWT